MEKLIFQRKAPVFWEECAESTSSELKTMADKGAEDGTVLVADSQSGGRGRQGRSFISPVGGLYMSMLIRPSCLVESCSQITPLAAVAAQRAVKELTGLEADIKWPNDLLLRGKKFCGILTELSFDSYGKPQIILGVGINLNTPREEFQGELEDIACSVYSYCGKIFDKNQLLELLLKELDEYIFRWEHEGCFFLEEYRQLNICRKRDVFVIKDGKQRLARAIEIEDDFSLLVSYENQKQEKLYWGEISVRDAMKR